MFTTVVTFAGNLTDDPELRFTPSGKAVTNVRVLVNRREKNSADEWVDAEPTPHNIEVWGDPAEHVAESLAKGNRVLVHGVVETRSWEDRESGEKRTKTVVVVNERFGEIGASLSYAVARPARVERTKQTQQQDPWS